MTKAPSALPTTKLSAVAIIVAAVALWSFPSDRGGSPRTVAPFALKLDLFTPSSPMITREEGPFNGRETPGTSLSDGFRWMDQLRARPTAMQARRIWIQETALQSSALDESKRILTDLQYASDTYGADQAIARIYSIELLGEAARRGSMTPLEETIRICEARMPPTRSRGQAQDLSDLLTAWINAVGEEKILQNPSMLFSTFHYTQELHRIFSIALLNAYGSDKDDPDFSSETDRLLRQEKVSSEPINRNEST